MPNRAARAFTAFAAAAFVSCVGPRPSHILVIRDAPELVLREASCVARARVDSSVPETYGLMAPSTCGYRVEATPVDVIKGCLGHLQFLSESPLEPGREYLVATRDLALGSSEDPFIQCRLRVRVHEWRRASFAVIGGELYVVDPRGDIVLPAAHPDAPDRSPVAWPKARSTIAGFLASGELVFD